MSLRLGLSLMVPASARPTPTGPPVNTVLPSITGARTQGQTLTANPGSWTGLPSSAFTYQWQRSGTNIGGATSSTYVAQAADFSAGASALTVEVTGTNSFGGGSSTMAESLGVTIAAPLSISGTPSAASVGSGYSFIPTNSGGHTPKTYALTGTLPSGLSFNTATGEISGTPVTSGTASGLNITVTDADGLTASLGTFSLLVNTAGETPAWLLGLELVNDISVNNTLAGTTRAQSNGCLLRIRHNLGSLTSWDASKVTLPGATDPGFNADGTPNDAVPRVLPIVGVGRWYKPYPDGDAAGNAKYTDADVGTGYIDIGLSQRLYNSLLTDYTGRDYQTNPGVVTFAEGFLNGTSAAGSSSTVARSDNLEYWPAIWKHLNPVLPRVAANGSLTIEWTAGHRFPQNGQPIACLEAWTWDGSNAGSVVRASTMAESTWTDGLDAPSGLTVDTFQTTLSFSGLPNGKLGVRSRVKPWSGPCVESTDTGVGDDFDTAFTQNLYATFPVYHDLTGDRSPIYGKLRTDGGGRTSADKTGIFTSKAAALADATGFASAQLIAASAVLYNSDTSLRTGGTSHATTDGIRIICPTSAGSLGSDAGAYSIATQITAATGHFPIIFESEAGVPSTSARLRGRTAAGASITLATKTPGANAKKFHFKGFVIDGHGTSGDDRAVINFGGAPTGNSSGALAEYVTLEDCEVRGEIAGATVVPVNATRAMYLYRTRIVNNRYRVGWGGVSGAVVQVGCKMEGDTNVDGLCALACWMTNGEVTGANFDQGNQVAFNQASSPFSAPSMSPSKQFFIHNCRFDTWNKGGVGGCNDPAGRADQIIGRYWAGIVFGGRYANVNNTLVDFSDDLIIPGTERNVLIGISTAGTELGITAMRMNSMYQDYGWVRTDKTAAFLFSYYTALPCKNTWFNGNASMTNTGAGPAIVWSNTRRYYAGEAVYDPAGGLLPQTGAPVYQVLQYKPDGTRITSVPPGTLVTDTNYWFHPPNNLVGSQPRRTGNEAYRLGVDNHCVLGSGAYYEGGALTVANHGSLADYEWTGTFQLSPGVSSFNGVVTSSLYENDSAEPGADPTAQNFRPAPGSPLIGLRPAACAWDLRDQLGQLRPLVSAGAAGALELVPDTTPNAFSFTDAPGVDLSTVTTSAGVPITGINTPTTISVTGGQYSLDGTNWTSTSGTFPVGGTVYARGTSSASNSTAVNVVVTIGGVSDTFTITTVALGSRPVNSVAPAITGMNPLGTATPNAVLTCSTGTWSGSPTGYDFQWKLAGVNVGTNANTYVPTDVSAAAKAITCEVTASNANGPSLSPGVSNSVNTFNPSQLSPIAVFDAENAAQMALTGANVTSWTASGSATLAVTDQSGTLAQPQYSATSFNGRPGVTGNGTSQFLETTSGIAGVPTGATGCEIWVVLNQPDADSVTNTRVLGGWGNTGNTDYRARYIYKSRTATIASLHLACGNGTGTDYQPLTPAAGGFVGRHVARGVYTGTTFTPHLDGIAGTTNTETTNSLAARFRLFANPTNSGLSVPQHHSNATINAFMLVPVLTSDQAAAMLAWCNQRKA